MLTDKFVRQHGQLPPTAHLILCAHARMHTHLHTHTYTQTYTDAHAHAQAHTCILPHPHPPAQQISMYDAAVAVWAKIKSGLHAAMVLTGTSPRDVMKTYWATMQRFFKLLCVSLKVG